MLPVLRRTLCGLAIVVVGVLPTMLGAPGLMPFGLLMFAAYIVGGTVAILGLLAMVEHLWALARRQRTAPPSA